MPRKALNKAQINAKLKGGWFKSLWKKAKSGYRKHVHKHVKKAASHAKKVARQAASEAKKQAIAHGKAMLEEAKQQAHEAIQDTIESATEAATNHVRKTVCGAVGSGFFAQEKRKMKTMARKHFNAVHAKSVAHVRRGGKGAGIAEHGEKAKARFEKSVDTIKNSAKGKIRDLAGCEGEGFQVRGAGLRLKGAGAGKSKFGARSTPASQRRREEKMTKEYLKKKSR